MASTGASSKILAAARKGGSSYTGHFVRREQIHRFDQRIDPVTKTMANVQGVMPEARQRQILSADTRQSVAPVWSRKHAPTHFVALRVPRDCALIKSVTSYREEVRAMSEAWAGFVVPPEKLHLTLGVMTLQNPEVQAPKIAKTLEDAASCIRNIRLRFNGLGTFGRGRVIFARPSADEDMLKLTHFVSALRAELSTQGVDIKGNPNDDYTPHVTIAKVTPKIRSEFGFDVFPTKMYALAKNDEMGAVVFRHLQLCSMTEAHEDGYWKIHHQSILQN